MVNVRPLEQIPQYYRLVRPEILSAVPSSATRILDVGCGAGMLGKSLKENRGDRTVVGLELDEEACYYANLHLDTAYCVNLETFDPPFSPGTFDCIVFADVLEHLQDPWAIARRYVRFLEPGGTVVASIPNIRHFPLLRQVLEQGRWDYRDWGILDRTHLRFFTKQTFLELLQHAEIDCTSISYLGGEQFKAFRPQDPDRIFKIGNVAIFNVSDEDFEELCAYQLLYIGVYSPQTPVPPEPETPETQYSVSVIVPWWDREELLELWDNNIEQLSDTEVIFIDNGSSEPGRNALADFCDAHGIRLIRNETNLGFTVANNQGAKIASGDYLLFLNNDVDILKSPVRTLCRLAGNGIAGPGPMGNELTGETFVEGWALCIAKSTFEEVGGWCEDYGIGSWDDADLCHQVRMAGYSITPVPELFSQGWKTGNTDTPQQMWVRHLGGTTLGDGRIDKMALQIRNWEILMRRHYQLRDINWIVFPDWDASEESLFAALSEVLAAFVTHLDRDRMTLLVAIRERSPAEIELFLSGVIMNLLMETDIELDSEPQISFIGHLDRINWNAPLPRQHAEILLNTLTGRLVIDVEDTKAVEASRSQHLPTYTPTDLQDWRSSS
ncbi:hypothetical protein AY599_14295 [Leptolyngbya valderiana BDU 20041]|nr:hypothetical protein AY599_14295 [Leptolyngbya valderiana BDU 20041]